MIVKVHDVLVNCFIKLIKVKCDSPKKTTAVDWDVKQQTKKHKKNLNRINVGCVDYL